MLRRWRQLGQASARAVSIAALGLLMALEGFVALPYKDIAGIWTDGYGNTEHVVPGKAVTEEQAQVTLKRHINVFASGIDSCLLVTPTQNQYDALMLWTYNVGVSAACHSTLIRQLNEGALPSVWCKQLLSWNKVHVNGQLVPSRGLTNRRQTEYSLCMKDSNGKS
jgi:lysozyme